MTERLQRPVGGRPDRAGTDAHHAGDLRRIMGLLIAQFDGAPGLRGQSFDAIGKMLNPRLVGRRRRLDRSQGFQNFRRKRFTARTGAKRFEDLEASDRGACGRSMGWGLLSGVSHDD